MNHVLATCMGMIVAFSSVTPAQTTRPSLFLVGDSTVKNGTRGQEGWGTPIAQYFDPAKVNVVNRAIGGRSSRSFIAEGQWDKVLAEAQPGDVVLIQFGHNDGTNPARDPKHRGSIRGIGDETVEVKKEDGTTEIVHSYGWYLRKYIADARTRGLTPVILSLVPRNDWKDGKVIRGTQSYAKWAREVAEAERAAFVDLNEICARRYEALGETAVKAFFPDEHTHTNAAGADVNAQCVVAGLKALKDLPLADFLSAKGSAVPAFTE